MRRRSPLNVWPAYADLMTVLAVAGLFAALSFHSGPGARDLARQLRALSEDNRRLDRLLAESRRRFEDLQRRYKQRITESARNERMFRAIQEVQELVDAVPAKSHLVFGSDQTLQFGDDLVSFPPNGVEPVWQPDGQERLRRFCTALALELGALIERSPGAEPRFMIEVEGHTDATTCPDDPHCNWWISSGRAASFVAVMRQPKLCPGGDRWDYRPIGYADTRPAFPGGVPTRRIAVRITPDYRRIIAGFTPGR